MACRLALAALLIFGTLSSNAADESPADKISYRGYTINVSAITDKADIRLTLPSLKKQIDSLEDVKTSESIHAFFRTVPIIMEPSGHNGLLVYTAVKRAVKLGAQKFDDKPILIHEMLHALHHQYLPQHNKNPDVIRFLNKTKEAGIYPAKAYMFSNPGEYFAMVGSVYLHGWSKREPFTRKELCTKQKDVCEWQESVFNPKNAGSP